MNWQISFIAFSHTTMGATSSERRSCPCKRLPWSLSSFTAAEFGEVHSLLKRRQGWNCKDSAGYSPLHFAAQNNHVAATSLLLRGGVNVNGDDDMNDALERKTATPLHRAAFAGATATMRLLLQEQDCELLARDNSFGDRKTPLHKAAAGGRYLAAQLLLDELRSRGQLPEALKILDSSSRTPLQVAQDLIPQQNSERESVARWDTVAGGIADWTKCVALLEKAARHVLDSHMMLPQKCTKDFPMPPQHLSSVDSCLDCVPSSNGVCSTMSWQAAFQSALGSAVDSSLSSSSFHQQEHAPLDAASQQEVCTELDTELPEPQNRRANQRINVGVACRICDNETISLFLSPKGLLVCKACHGTRRELELRKPCSNSHGA
jgi:hypothetical protein